MLPNNINIEYFNVLIEKDKNTDCCICVNLFTLNSLKIFREIIK